MNTTINVPERNRRVKKLLQDTYPGVGVKVSAGNGTAYHWINIAFDQRVGNPPGMMHNNVKDAIADLIVGAGIEISKFLADDAGRPEFGDLPCININMPRKPPFDQERQHVADYIAQALRESPAFQNKEGWSSKATVEESVTTSDCPLITFTLDDGQAFNITVTRKRT